MKIVQEKGRLKYNCYSNRQNVLSNTISIIFAVALSIIYFVILDINFVLTFIFYFLNWFFIAIIIAYWTNDIERAILKYNKTLDFKKLEDVINDSLLNNLHSETRKELILRYAVLLFAYDKEKAISMLSTIEKPKNELWGFIYELKKVEYFLEEGKEEVAKQLFYELKAVPTKNKRILNTLNHVEQLHFQKDESIEFVKKLIFTSRQNKFLKAASYIDLMEYYYLRNNIEEAKKYAEEFLMLKTNMTELENKAKKLFETIV